MTGNRPLNSRPLHRRGFLTGALGVLALTGCAAQASGGDFLDPASQRVDDAEADRETTGETVTVTLTAAASTLTLGTTTAETWSFGEIPAPVIRMNAGDRLQATLRNRLPEETTIHWHGLALRNDMDGVPAVTQEPVPAGGDFTYDFIAPHPGTYWFHPHVGAQLDRGLYGALIVDDPEETLDYDRDWVIILDDWLDGVTATPDEVLTELTRGMGDMGGMDHGSMGGPMRMGNTLMGASSDVLGGDAGDVFYPHYLVNGRGPDDPETFTAKPGERIRLRIINAGGDTAFRLALTGHRLTVTHTDGFPVEPTETDSLLLGMGERYDAIVTVGDGVFALVAEAEGKTQRTHALLRAGSGQPPALDGEIGEFGAAPLTAEVLTAAKSVALPSKTPDEEITIRLTGSMAKYDWAFDGNRFDHAKPLENAWGISEGDRVRVRFVNDTDMWHPIHLHGHTYQLAGGGPRKDTSIVLPGATLTVDFDANNPGRWLTHCHNVYHGEAGMMGVIAYRA
ncbi:MULTISPECIES: multicopper oxidase family protein [Brevibacterium]|uniref:multicopper oxidase family protein n=1 Tax=Brevibacterium TaxID=1696 RepID=UPI0011A6E8E5|nr:multicopper oxidase family protein [Brevibacterium casei]NJE65804.1 multicopper oxidase family protein [Brevibacterium sp. LS14]MBE4693227.1 multicopper oxidase family protein [Brevibacterium casei]MBY3576350.1 multicopper oxidase family protein [Brevibacterium casei]MCT1447872.1 multicopper oxidase family protein [Brevibacterium casei]MDH5149974.1 multicopper oxidase family protein [Brevibacterium casei]